MITQIDSENPWSTQVGLWVQRQFPRQFASGTELVDVLTAEILGTKQQRYGPKPTVEAQVKIRNVIRYWTQEDGPIPFMVPWGSEKPDGTTVDVAELGALKMLDCLDKAVRQHYEPGVKFNVRLEDASAPYLFNDRPDAARQEAARYTNDLRQLVKVLDLPSVDLVPESSLINEFAFNVEADRVLPAVEEYVGLVANSNQVVALTAAMQAFGWKGTLTRQTVQYYLAQYVKMNPTASQGQHLHTLARYFASALARARLKIRGDDPGWAGRFIDLSFVAPIPGTESVFDRRVYYRTLPLEATSNHIPPWRAKGYLLINNDSDVTPKLASFNEVKNLGLTPSTLHLKSDSNEVVINADYLLQ